MIKFLIKIFCRHENHTGYFIGMEEFECPKCGNYVKLELNCLNVFQKIRYYLTS